MVGIVRKVLGRMLWLIPLTIYLLTIIATQIPARVFAQAATPPTLNGYQLNANETKWVQYIADSVEPLLPDTGTDGRAGMAARVTWWSLREGVLDAYKGHPVVKENPIGYSNCGDTGSNDYKKLIEKCETSTGDWQLGISAVHLNAHTKDEVEKRALDLHPGMTIEQILSQVVTGAEYSQSDPEYNAVVNSKDDSNTNKYHTSLVLRDPATGFTFSYSDVGGECFPSTGASKSWCFGQSYTPAKELAPDRTSAEGVIKELTAYFKNNSGSASNTSSSGLGAAGGCLGGTQSINEQLQWPWYVPSGNCAGLSNCSTSSTSLDAFLRALSYLETGGTGSPTTGSPSSTDASGKYQYLNSTWQDHLKQYYDPALAAKYPRARDAPEAVQDAVAYIEYTDKAAQFKGDVAKMAVSHIYPAFASDPTQWDQKIGNNPTAREYAKIVVDNINSGKGSTFPMTEQNAPNFQKYLSKYGTPPDLVIDNSEVGGGSGSSSVAGGSSTSCVCSPTSGTTASNTTGGLNIDSVVSKYPLQSVLVKQVGGGVVAAHNADQPPASVASVMKLIVADVFLHTGPDLSKSWTVKQQEISNEGDIWSVGSSVSLETALTKTLGIDSSNEGANILIDAAGGPAAVGKAAHDLGYSQTDIVAYYHDPHNVDGAGRQQGDNKTTVTDLTTAIEKIYNATGSGYQVAQSALVENFYHIVPAPLAAKWGMNPSVSGNSGLFDVNGNKFIITLYINQTGKNAEIKAATEDIIAALSNGKTMPSSPTPTTSGCTSSSSIVQTVLQYAWSNPGHTPATEPTAAYQAAIKKAISNNEYTGASGGGYDGIDCGAFVTRVMRDSGADPAYNKYKDNGGNVTEGNTIWQKKYLDQAVGQGKYKPVTVNTIKDLQTGDIAISTDHTFIYMGSVPSFNGNHAYASQSTDAPTAGTVDISYMKQFNWYRLLK